MVYSAELYVHDLDKQAADALNQFPKFVKLLESYAKAAGVGSADHRVQ